VEHAWGSNGDPRVRDPDEAQDDRVAGLQSLPLEGDLLADRIQEDGLVHEALPLPHELAPEYRRHPRRIAGREPEFTGQDVSVDEPQAGRFEVAMVEGGLSRSVGPGHRDEGLILVLARRTLSCNIIIFTVTISTELLRLKLAESLSSSAPPLTRRDVHLPAVPGKALAVIGVRRSGKTSYLMQCRADRRQEGSPPEAELLVSLEDERLAGITVRDLDRLLEEHARLHPGVRETGRMALYLDEVQVVPGWEGLVRRLIDERMIRIMVSGSSARLLSREVATGLRGRAMEVLVHPFSFREVLRHTGDEPGENPDHLDSTERRALDHGVRRYLSEGGFPEAQGASPRDRAALLAGYVDVVVLRDVIERHAVSNPLALRWLQRQLLANPGGRFSVQKHYDTLRSQGVPVGKDTLHEYLAHLEDTFLVRTIAIHAASERKRMVNPRKAYPVDPGLISLFERSGREHTGRALETAILLELERRGYETAYVRTREGFEVDFLAHRTGDPPLLIQSCLQTEADETWERELRALEAAAAEHPTARPILVTLDAIPPSRPMPAAVTWIPAANWLLAEA
jgi:hypothetical protein